MPSRGGVGGVDLSMADLASNQPPRPGAAPDAAHWFGPLDPPAPVAPSDIASRQWDFPVGYNLAQRPRLGEPVDFAVLRSLADSYDLLRLVIETRKDQVARMDWSVRPRASDRLSRPDAGRVSQPGDDRRAAGIVAFLRRPDGLHGFSDWLRMLLEDLFVIDAPTLYRRRDRAGRLIALLPLDGATIKPVIDAWGRPPQPALRDGEWVEPAAFQQILKGLPAVDYSARDLYYRPRNPRTHRAYGFSPVEQILASVNIALRRQVFTLEYFASGNIPDCLIGVPDSWTPDQIASYQTYWDAYVEGDLARRRKAKFVPGGVAKTFVQTKEPELKGEFDEWLARLVCFAFSISPMALMRPMNRASAQTQKESAQEEGLQPILAWAKDLIDEIIAEDFGAPDLEFAWGGEPAADPAQQATILTSYVQAGIMSVDEARAQLGLPPLAPSPAQTLSRWERVVAERPG